MDLQMENTTLTYSCDDCDDDYGCKMCNISYWPYFQFDSLNMPDLDIAIKTIVLVLITLPGLVGNLSILIIIMKNKLLRLQATNLFLFNMAVADFLTLLIIPFLYYFKQKVIFRMYKLGRIPCRLTPFLIVTFFLSGSLSLMVISLNRLCGIVFPNVAMLRLKRKTVLFILAAIWAVSVAFAAPTMFYRRYWTRQWSDMMEVNCDDSPDLKDSKNEYNEVEFRCDFEQSFNNYWFSLLAINVWMPTLVMFVCYAVIFFKLKKSMKAFPYLSEQSRIARTRENVIKMLFILFLVQVVCWGPWQFYTVFTAYIWFAEPRHDVCFDEELLKNITMDDLKKIPWSNRTVEWNDIEPIIHDIKFYFIFANSALNPFIYGYCNETMRKAFRITFTCLFKEKPKYVLQRGGAAGYSQFYFNKANKLNHSTSIISKSIFTIGKTAMAPINPNGQQLVYPKSRIDRVKRQFNKRVVAITTDSLRIGKQNKNVKRRIGKSPSEGYVSQIDSNQSMTGPGTISTSFQTSMMKKVSFANFVDENGSRIKNVERRYFVVDDKRHYGSYSDGEQQQQNGKVRKAKKWRNKSDFFRRRHFGNNSNDKTESDICLNSGIRTSRLDFPKASSIHMSSPNSGSELSSMGVEVNCEVDIKLNVRIFDLVHSPTSSASTSSATTTLCSTCSQSKSKRRFSDPGPIEDLLI